MVAIIGVGIEGFRPAITELSYKELMFEAARKAYEDANIDPRKDVQSFIACGEDFWWGTSITDEYVPDQIGAAQKSVCTISGDGIHGLITAYMHIQSGIADIAVVEAHSKASEVMRKGQVEMLGLDPIYNRPLNIHPNVIAGLEAQRFLSDNSLERHHLASIVAKNKKNALLNGRAAYGEHVSKERVLSRNVHFSPLTDYDISEFSDGCVVLVVASDEAAKKIRHAVSIAGVGWATHTNAIESRDWTRAVYAELCAKQAYKMAGIKIPAKELNMAEIDDTFSYKELQHLLSLGVVRQKELKAGIESGQFERNGGFPVNPSGGCIGMGNAIDANGLQRVSELTLQIRGEAGECQIKDVRKGLAFSWRGVPTTTGAAVILEG